MARPPRGNRPEHGVKAVSAPAGAEKHSGFAEFQGSKPPRMIWTPNG